MTRNSIILLFAIGILLPGFAGAVSEKDFEAQTTKNIVNLCTASPDDPLYHQAINCCHGYLVGAYHYHEATALGPAGIQLVCAPNPRPSRNARSTCSSSGPRHNLSTGASHLWRQSSGS